MHEVIKYSRQSAQETKWGGEYLRVGKRGLLMGSVRLLALAASEEAHPRLFLWVTEGEWAPGDYRVVFTYVLEEGTNNHTPRACFAK